ncbi:MAG: hypothetical protein PHE93_01495 [Clostridia bacterium]|nr:hypothetical protein [Clostridia bacterium]
MIESKVNKKYNIWVMAGLGVVSILAAAYSIWQGYAEYFAGTAADIAVAIFQILLFDGIVAIAISYIWATIMHNIMSRTLGQWYISRFDFCFYYMFFIAVSRVVIAIIGAFQFLTPAMSIYFTYLSGLIFSTTAMALYFFMILKKSYIPQGKWSAGFKGFAIPYLVIQGITYLSSAIIWGASDYFEPILNELGYVLFFDNGEIYAVITGAVVLALFIGGAFGAYYWLKKKDKESKVEPTNTQTEPPKEDEKVFEEFDI